MSVQSPSAFQVQKKNYLLQTFTLAANLGGARCYEKESYQVKCYKVIFDETSKKGH